MLRLGIAGLGFMGRTYLAACKNIEEISITALCSRRDPAAALAEADAGNLKCESTQIDSRWKVYSDFDDLVSDREIDAVALCLPTFLHKECAIKALENGKHVICEKPMARSSPEATEMAEAAARTGKLLIPAMCVRFWPAYRWLKEVIGESVFGEVYSAHFKRISPPPSWGASHFLNGEKSGGALFDLHIHDVDFIRFCFGEIGSVFARGISRLSGSIDHVAASYEVPGQAVVTAEASWLSTPSYGFTMRYEVNCRDARLVYDFRTEPDAVWIYEGDSEPRKAEMPAHDAYEAELRAFARLALGKTDSIEVTPVDGIRSLQVCEAEEQSIRQGAAIRI